MTATAGPTDTIAPTLVAASPSSAAAPVPVSQVLSLTFSEPVVYRGGSIRLTGGASPLSLSGAQIQVTGKHVTVTPSADLAPSTTYTIDFSQAMVSDLAGNAFAPSGAAAVSFKTGGALYAAPNKGNNSTTGRGTVASPYDSIGHATKQARPGDTIYVVLDATKVLANSYAIEAAGTAASPVVIKPAPGGSAKYAFTSANGLTLPESAKHVVIEGFEFYGQSDKQDHWDLVARGVWAGKSPLAIGSIAINVEAGTDITIRNNYFHDLQQKAVNITGGRYVNVVSNIIRDVATKSLSGGHGIMRQQGDASNFGTADDATKYRWDINGNLIFNVEQRIYSWVPAKGFMNMTLDEGKPILIDETTDRQLKARIANNIVAYASIDSIRIKPTPNLEVVNNSVYTQGAHADGITDINTLASTAPFDKDPTPGLVVANNLVMTAPGTFAFELNDGYPTAASAAKFSGNVRLGSGGTVNPTGLPGASAQAGSSLFVNPNAGNFMPAAGVPLAAGAPADTRATIDSAVSKFGVTVAPANWVTDELKLTQSFLDNIPGLDDGIANNETVFTGPGQYGASDSEIDRKAFYFAVNSAWKTSIGLRDAALTRTRVPAFNGLYELIVPSAYSTWYDAAKLANPSYASIRHGNSYIAQNKAFPANSLLLTALGGTAAGSYNQILAAGQTITLGGDLRIVFSNGYTPKSGDSFDIIKAGAVIGNFANVNLPASVGAAYSLNVVSGNTLRLTFQ
jgi:hypothetical protein